MVLAMIYEAPYMYINVFGYIGLVLIWNIRIFELIWACIIVDL